MPWFRDLDREESGLELCTGEIEELENDELELREAVFIRNYEEEGVADYYDNDEAEWE